MTIHTDILILGGGISGLLTARELCLAGLKVVILDKSQLGRESSWAGGGILLPIYPWRQDAAISALVVNSLNKYPQLNRALLAATGIDPEWRDCGMLICKNPDVSEAVQWCQQYGIVCQTAPFELLEGLHTLFAQPLWLPEIAQIRNPRLLKSLLANLRQSGVEFIENTEIGRLMVNRRRLERLDTSNGSFSFGHLIVCTGAWTTGFLETLLPSIPESLNLSIQPIKGQMLVFNAKPETLGHMVLDGDQYLIPRRDGRILAGSTVETSGFDKSVTDEARQKLYEFATGLLPDIAQFPVEHHWAGLRPGTPLGVPYIGLHPDYENLGVNAGHFRNGLVMGPASAKLIADLILHRTTSIDPGPYALNREN